MISNGAAEEVGTGAGGRGSGDPWEKSVGDDCNSSESLFSSNKCTIDPWRCGTLNACRVDAIFPEIMRLAVVCAESNRCSVQLEGNLFANSLFPI